MSQLAKTVVFYTKDAGLSVADAKRMEEAGFICVKVKDPTKITAPSLSESSWFPINDQMTMIVWKAMCHSQNAKDKFGQLMISAIDNQQAMKAEQS